MLSVDHSNIHGPPLAVKCVRKIGVTSVEAACSVILTEFFIMILPLSNSRLGRRRKFLKTRKTGFETLSRGPPLRLQKRDYLQLGHESGNNFSLPRDNV